MRRLRPHLALPGLTVVMLNGLKDSHLLCHSISQQIFIHNSHTLHIRSVPSVKGSKCTTEITSNLEIFVVRYVFWGRTYAFSLWVGGECVL